MKKILLKVVGVSGWIEEAEDFKVGQIFIARLGRKWTGYCSYEIVHKMSFTVHVYNDGSILIPGIDDLKLQVTETKKPKLIKRDTTSKHGIPVDKRRCRRLFRQVSKNTIREGGVSYWKKAARNHRR